jgi:hypothetical protein
MTSLPGADAISERRATLIVCRACNAHASDGRGGGGGVCIKCTLGCTVEFAYKNWGREAGRPPAPTTSLHFGSGCHAKLAFYFV